MLACAHVLLHHHLFLSLSQMPTCNSSSSCWSCARTHVLSSHKDLLGEQHVTFVLVSWTQNGRARARREFIVDIGYICACCNTQRPRSLGCAVRSKNKQLASCNNRLMNDDALANQVIARCTAGIKEISSGSGSSSGGGNRPRAQHNTRIVQRRSSVASSPLHDSRRAIVLGAREASFAANKSRIVRAHSYAFIIINTLMCVRVCVRTSATKHNLTQHNTTQQTRTHMIM